MIPLILNQFTIVGIQHRIAHEVQFHSAGSQRQTKDIVSINQVLNVVVNLGWFDPHSQTQWLIIQAADSGQGQGVAAVKDRRFPHLAFRPGRWAGRPGAGGVVLAGAVIGEGGGVQVFIQVQVDQRGFGHNFLNFGCRQGFFDDDEVINHTVKIGVTI